MRGDTRKGLTGNSTVAPIVERAAAAFELREAPTHAQVSSSDRGASTGRSFLTTFGKKVLHSNPAVACCVTHCLLTQIEGLREELPG